MEIMVSVVSNNIALWDCVEQPDSYIQEYIGDIEEESFYSEQRKINNKKIRQFMFIHVDFNTIFNFKQVKQLDKEIKILEENGDFKKEILKVIKNGIKKVLDNKNLYLKFEYD